MRHKSQKACQFVSLLIRFACVAILYLVTSTIPMTTARMKRIVLIGFSAMVLLSTGSGQSHSQTRSPSFRYVATAGGELQGLSKPIVPLPVGQKASQTMRMSPAHRVNEATQELASMGTVQILLVLHLADGFVLLICFFSLGINNPWKWFQQTRMKNMK